MDANDPDVASEGSRAELTAVFEVLAHPYRRTVLRALCCGEPRDLRDLAEQVHRTAGLESVDRATVALHHHHLPRMAEAGIVRYDAVEQRCALRDAEPAVALLRTARREL